MEWLSQLLKHLKDSRIFTGAAFVTCAVILFGNHLLPNSIPELASHVRLVAIAGLVFTGALVLLDIIPGVANTLKTWLTKAKQYVLGRRVTELEQVLILVMSDKPDQPLNLYELDFENSGITPIAAFNAASDLEAKGYISINRFHRKYIKLTGKGRRLALKTREAFAQQI
jgi:hypothetical protein